jgi:hypothetical protein
VSIIDISGAAGGLPARRPWWFGPAIVAVAVGATVGIVVSEPAPPPTPAELVRESVRKFARLTSYHKVGVATYPDPRNAGGRRQITVDVERPGKSRIVWDSDDSSGSTEFLQVDNRRYERRPPEGWFENVFRPPDPSGLASRRSPLGEPWAVVDSPTMREIDQARIDGLSTHHIRYAATPAFLADTVFAAIGVDTQAAFRSGVNVQSTVEVWIRTADMEIVRVRYVLINAADEYRFEESYLFRDEAPRIAIVAPATVTGRATLSTVMLVSAYLAATSGGNEIAALQVWHVSVAMSAEDRERRVAATHDLASQRVGRDYTVRGPTYAAVSGGPAVAERDARWAWMGVTAIDEAGSEHQLTFMALVSDFPMLSSTSPGPGNTWTLYDVIRAGDCGVFAC